MAVGPPSPLTPREGRIGQQLDYGVRAIPHTVVRATSADAVTVYGGRQVPGAILSPPFHQLDVGVWSEPWAEYGRTESLTVDLAGTPGIGAIVDGVARSNTAEYLIWAVQDVNGSIEGAVATRVPQDTGVAVASGTMGGTATLSSFTSAGYTNLFTVGARILIRLSTSLGAQWNQGTIATIDTGAGSMTVDLDAALAVTAETNTNLTGSDLTVIQLDNYEPRVVGSGIFEDRKFALIGRIVTDSSGNVLHALSPREWIPLSGVTFRNTSHSATNITRICLGRWLPRWTPRLQINQICTVSSVSGGNATYGFRTQSGWQISPRTDRLNILSQQSNPSASMLIRNRDCSIEGIAIVSGTVTIAVFCAIVDYAPEGRW